MFPIYANLEQRLIAGSALDPDTGCWQWLRALSKNGYGRINTRAGGLHISHWAHRLAFEIMRDETIPPRMELDHKCRNRGCINPDHMEVVTKAENLKRRGRLPWM